MLVKDADLLEDDPQEIGKFLARRRSPPLSQICFCCSHLLQDQAEAFLEQSTTFPTGKISIKQIINRNRSVQGIPNQNWNKNKANQSRQQNRIYLSGSNKNQYKKTDYGKDQRPFTIRYNQLPAHIANKIMFTYDSKAKKIGQVVSSRMQKKQTSHQADLNKIKIQVQKATQNQISTMNKLQIQFNDVLDSKKADSSEYHENDSRQSQIAKQSQFTPQKKVKQAVKTDYVSTVNFSFGHRQKTQFMTSYMKQAASKPPQTIKELKQSLLQLQSKYLSNDSFVTNRKQKMRDDQKQIQFMRGTFNRKGTMNYIHRIQTVSQDVAVSESDRSVVIDDFHSIMDNLKRKKTREFEGSQKLGSCQRYV